MYRKVIETPKGYPFFRWGHTSIDKIGIKKYIENKPLKKDDPMIIYNGQAGFHVYILAKVINPAYGKNKNKIKLSKEAASVNYKPGNIFWKTGICVNAPTGQSYMLPPISEIMEYLTFNNYVQLDKIY